MLQPAIDRGEPIGGIGVVVLDHHHSLVGLDTGHACRQVAGLGILARFPKWLGANNNQLPARALECDFLRVYAVIHNHPFDAPGECLRGHQALANSPRLGAATSGG